MHELISQNFSWMIYNLLLALIPVFLGWLVLSFKNSRLKALFFIAWLIFVPNTIYVFTDIIHLIKDITRINNLGIFILILQYLGLFLAGFITYILSLYPIEKTLTKLNKKNKKKNKNAIDLIILINFLIGFGIVLGRIYRLNSWDVIFQTMKVNSALYQIISSPKMIILAILFGLLANFIYFLFKKKTISLMLGK